MPQINLRGSLLTIFAALLFILSASDAAQSQIRTEIPTEDPGPPFYARVERQAVHTQIVPHTDEWAAVVFYRSPGCVPPDFNLMDLFHVPNAFFCPLTFEGGFEIWRNGPPPIDFTPMMAVFRGKRVPIWFVSWSELQAAVADDVLTRSELETMPSLITGIATSFHETLHPTDGAVNPKLLISAAGSLSDGRTFQMTHSGQAGGIQTRIRFK